jgi:MYXO-CTERM domain-containing protein
MRTDRAWTFAALFACTTSAAAAARADVTACPASMGGYSAIADGSTVIVCPTPTPPPGLGQPAVCPFTLGMARVDTLTGAVATFTGPCVADPRSDAGSDAGTPCYLDPCVPAGTYEYGYTVAAFAGCDNACAGPTSGELAVVVTVAGGPPSSCDAGFNPGVGQAWPALDASIEDGALTWTGTCTGPLPGPDGGYCAWTWLDGAAQWAHCPDSGTLCPGYGVDGAVMPVVCPSEDGGSASLPEAGTQGSVEAGQVGGGLEGGALDAAAPVGAEEGKGDSGGGGGCGCATTPGGAAASLAPLAALLLAIGVRRGERANRKRRDPAGGGS